MQQQEMQESAKTQITVATGFVAEAESYEIDCAEIADMASVDLNKYKDHLKRVDELRKSATRPLDEAKKTIMEWFRPATEHDEKAIDILSGKLKSWVKECQRKRDEEERRAREAAREAARVLAEQAKAEAEKGNHEEAKALETQAAIMPSMAALAVQPSRKIVGTSTKETWKAEITDVKELLRAVLDDRVSIAAITVNQTFLDQMARSMKEAYNIPGSRAVKDTILAKSR